MINGDGSAARTPWRWALFGAVLGMLGALVLWLPAHWATGLVADATGQRLALVNAQGTIWNGSAAVMLTRGEGGRDTAALPGRLAWRIRPGWTAVPGDAAGRAFPALVAVLSHDCCLRPQLRLVAARGKEHGSDGTAVIGVTALDWQGPAGLLRGLGKPWNTLAFEGELKLTGQNLQLRQTDRGWRLEGRLAMVAESVSSRISTVRPLGSYRMEIHGKKDSTELALSTLVGAALELNGQGAFIGRQLRFQGSARTEPERREALGNVLNLIGNRDGPVALRILR